VGVGVSVAAGVAGVDWQAPKTIERTINSEKRARNERFFIEFS
jgi:hypothetical protein